MIRFTLALPKYRLHIQVVRRRHSPHELTLKHRLQLILHIKKGSRLSRLFRHLFEYKKIKAFLGSQLALAGIAINILPSHVPVLPLSEAETAVLASPQVLTTQSPIIRYPLNSVKITQGYSLFHPALDFDGTTGDPVYPIMSGKVIHLLSASQPSSYAAYGNAILINHHNGYHSLYAHLSRINVNLNQTVTPETAIGQVGSTGRAFGDHLHLEVYQDNHTINPLSLLK